MSALCQKLLEPQGRKRSGGTAPGHRRWSRRGRDGHRPGDELNHLADFHETINATLLAGFDESERALISEFLDRMKRNAERALR